MEKQKLIAIVGPTASGKSALAVEIAQKLNGEIISADSAQVYRGFNIGTAKITKEEMRGIPHHLLDIADCTVEYNIGLFQKDAKEAIKNIAQRGKMPILCGGSGLYINSVLNKSYRLEDAPTSDPKNREYYMALEKTKGEGYLYQLLKEKFPLRAEKIHCHDYQRIIRGLEQKEDLPDADINSWDSDYNLSVYGLTMEREILYQRIEKRIDMMIEQGLTAEVEGLLRAGYSKNGNALSALGYKEIIPYLEDEYTLEEAIEILKKNTRHFAKRQLTWFKRDPRIIWFDVFKEGGIEAISDKIISIEKN